MTAGLTRARFNVQLCKKCAVMKGCFCSDEYRVKKVKETINQSNIRLLIRRVTRMTQTQADFTEELGVGKMNN